MNGDDDGQGTLLSLAVKTCVKLLKEIVCKYVATEHSEPCANYLRELLQSVPPNYHAEFLDQLSPVFDDVTGKCSDSATLDFIDELALILLSPSITHLDMDKYKYPTRNPSRYLTALSNARNLRGLGSSLDSSWKLDKNNFNLLSEALTQMPLLRHLVLRYVKLPSKMINKLLEGLGTNSPHLTYLDLKHVALTDSGLDPDSLKRFGPVEDFVDCIPALLQLRGLQYLNVSETWLTYIGVRKIVENLELRSLEAIMSSGYDVQAAVIKDLVNNCPEDEPPVSYRTSYTIAPQEPAFTAICTACPQLEHITLLQLSVQEVKPTFLTLALLQGLRRVTLHGLEWLLFHNHISLSDDPMPISSHVTEVSLMEPVYLDAYHLGALSICFPYLTHLRVEQPQHCGPASLWDCGPVFTRLTHLHYQGPLLTDLTVTHRFQRQQGLQTILDVLLHWSVDLTCITFYTEFINPDMLLYALRGNPLTHLKELRLGQQQDLSAEVITTILKDTPDLRVIGRTDMWEWLSPQTKDKFVHNLRERYRNLVVFGDDTCCDMTQDPHPVEL